MPLTPKERRALVAASHTLRPVAQLRAARMTPAAVAHIDAAFGDRELLKVRIAADDPGACDRAAGELAAQLGCEIVRRVGRVVILYRARPDAGAADGAAPGR